jgi:hypothetical protein
MLSHYRIRAQRTHQAPGESGHWPYGLFHSPLPSRPARMQVADELTAGRARGMMEIGAIQPAFDYCRYR